MSDPWLRRLRRVCAVAAWAAIGAAAILAVPLLIGDVPSPPADVEETETDRRFREQLGIGASEGTCGNLFSSEWRTPGDCHDRVTQMLWIEGSLLFAGAVATAGWIWAWRRD